MVSVFAIFGLLHMVEMKELGVGLAVAVLVDALVVRAILLPATDDAARRLGTADPPKWLSGCPVSALAAARGCRRRRCPPRRSHTRP